MLYPVAVEAGDAKHAFGVVVPDLPGCFSAGDTFEEALVNAREAIELHVEALLDAGDRVPAPSSVDKLVAGTRQRDNSAACASYNRPGSTASAQEPLRLPGGGGIVLRSCAGNRLGAAGTPNSQGDTGGEASPEGSEEGACIGW